MFKGRTSKTYVYIIRTAKERLVGKANPVCYYQKRNAVG